MLTACRIRDTPAQQAKEPSMRVFKAFAIVLGLIVILGLGFLVYAWRPEIAPVESSAPPTFDKSLIKRGAQLAAIGNCSVCHTAEGGSFLAGGRALETPFGKIYSTNISPDRETGIGRWPEAAFLRAMHEGVDRAGQHLYPAFPYDHFTLVNDEDNKALYAYLMSRKPVKASAHANELAFPFNIRMAIAGWKLLNFRQGRYQPDASKSESWNRGAYLAEGLGHCGACHTPRDKLGAEQKQYHFAGAEIERWYAYAINSQSPAPVRWTEDALAFYLRNGWHQEHGMARGPMTPVVENLSAVSDTDVRAIAAYVGSETQQAAQGESPDAHSLTRPKAEKLASADSLISPPTVTDANAGDSGARIYASACASCHEAGRPLPFGGINLALSTAMHGPTPHNVVNVTLYGLPARPGEPSPIMPGFRGSLTDAQLEALLKYLRSHFGNKPEWQDRGKIIREARSSEPPLYPSPGLGAAPADPSLKGAAW
jgi:mono/diheme cytochrome c family protein